MSHFSAMLEFFIERALDKNAIESRRRHKLLKEKRYSNEVTAQAR